MITTNGDYDLEEVKEKIRQYTVKGVVLKDLCEEALCASRRRKKGCAAGLRCKGQYCPEFK